MKIVVGLGNYETKYAHTHHNMGFLVVECLAKKLDAKFKIRECDSLIAKAFLGGETVILAEPQTHMNLSGVAVKQLLSKYKCSVRDLIVTYDDIDLPRYSVRFRQKGSGGTHNGMRDIVARLESEDFPRVRVGIGRPQPGVPLFEFVLSEVPKEDREQMLATIQAAAEEIYKLLVTA